MEKIAAGDEELHSACLSGQTPLQKGSKNTYSSSTHINGNNILPYSFNCEKADISQESGTFNHLEEQLKSGSALADWMIEKGKIQNHNGEFSLFTLGMLSTRKDEQLSGQPSLQSLKPSRAGREGQLYCRRVQSHKYLMASVSESAANDLAIEPKPQTTTYSVQFGRPTRSSLLRSAHQSASVSSNIPMERGLKKISSEACSGRASRQKGNCLDSQAFQKYGLFVSRSQPKVSFLTQCSADHKKRLDQFQTEGSKTTNEH
ncbi:uncharacterized protein [Phyllobates terribilis]|uniref:uncharacterized protein isoform X2 n=1 Tax=Phyllobates terribilis TaxID=111132 RepID=UPI003CCB0CDD